MIDLINIYQVKNEQIKIIIKYRNKRINYVFDCYFAGLDFRFLSLYIYIYARVSLMLAD